MCNVGCLLAAGFGSRYNSDTPKQHIQINGEELLFWGIKALKEANNIDKVLVVVENEKHIIDKTYSKYNVTTIGGGKTRAESFDKALKYINTNWSTCKKVIFHEAARPLITSDIFDLYCDLLDKYDYVSTTQKITDSLGCYDKSIKPIRENYYLIQAPEAYRFDILCKYFDVDSKIYYAADQLPSSCKGYLNFSIKHNYKLTYQEDYQIVEYLLKNSILHE